MCDAFSIHCIISNRTTVINLTALLESLDLTALLEYFNYQDFKGGLCGNLETPPGSATELWLAILTNIF